VPHITVLAFDYGLKNIGVAYGQSVTGTANELKPLSARDGVPNWEQVQALLKHWLPQQLLVGLPLNMDGTESELSARARKFANRLHGRFQLPVVLHDERLSSYEAKDQAHDRGHQGHYASSPIDSIAARLILESWLREWPQGKNSTPGN
jgi:putative Holliday junction resolvase